MMHLLWIGLALAGYSLETATAEQAKDVGADYVATLMNNDVAAFMELMDSRATLEFAVDDVSKLPPGFVEGYVQSADNSERGIFAVHQKIVADGGSFRPLRVVEQDGAQWVHLGVILPDHVMFNQVRLRVEVTDRGPRVVDLWALSTGRSISQGLADHVGQLVATDGVDRQALARLERVRPLVAMSTSGQWPQLLKAYDALPQESKELRMAMVLRINAARVMQDLPLLLTSIDQFLKAYPDDGAAHMFRIERAMQAPTGAGAAMLELDEAVGPDAFIQAHAALLLRDEGNTAEAIRVAKKACELEPGLADAAFIRLMIQATDPDPVALTASLMLVDKRFGLNVEGLKADPEFAQLVAHEGFARWVGQQK